MAYALAARLERAVKNAGVKYKKVSGWASRGHGTMGRIDSIMCHHTAGPKSGNVPSLNVVAYGRARLSGPLAQLFLARDGTVYLVAAGVSYHAGRVSSNRYTNSHSIGIEAENTGVSNDSPWPAHQVAEYAKLCKALADEFNLPISRVVGHKEATSRKIDPSFSMASFRAKVGGAKGGVSSGGGTSGGRSYESAKAKHTVGSRTMGMYDGGTDVLWLQKQLDVKPADSLFGPATKKAVEAYQRSRNLTVDGLAGKATIGALQGGKAPAKPKPSTPKHNPKAPAFPFPRGHWMGVPDSNPKNHSGYYSKDRPGIKLWQARMKARGWTIGVDGHFGPQSQKVAKQFQKQVKVAQDGLVGAVTFEKAWSAPVT